VKHREVKPEVTALEGSENGKVAPKLDQQLVLGNSSHSNASFL